MSPKLQIYTFITLWVIDPSLAEDGTHHLRECDLTAPENYSKLVPPNKIDENGEIVPIEVSFTLKIERFTEINDEKRFIDFQFVSTAFWRDHHLAKIDSNNCSGRVDQTEYFSKFWYPAVEYPSLTKARLDAFDESSHPAPVVDGMIFARMNTFPRMACNMDFSDFPFDSHKCPYPFISRFDTSDVVLLTAYGRMDSIVTGIHKYVIETEFYPPGETLTRSTGGQNKTYSMSGFVIRLRRRYRPYLNNIFVPLTVLVYISMISFSIPYNIVPGRMSLLMTIFLMIINTSNSARSQAPQSSRLSWLEIWLILIFISEALIISEYALILGWKKHLDGKKPKPGARGKADPKVLGEFDEWARRVDSLALRIFGFGFTLALVIYIVLASRNIM